MKAPDYLHVREFPNLVWVGFELGTDQTTKYIRADLHEKEVAALKEENERLKKDEERYRCLRALGTEGRDEEDGDVLVTQYVKKPGIPGYTQVPPSEDIDAAVDKAMELETNEQS